MGIGFQCLCFSFLLLLPRKHYSAPLVSLLNCYRFACRLLSHSLLLLTLDPCWYPCLRFPPSHLSLVTRLKLVLPRLLFFVLCSLLFSSIRFSSIPFSSLSVISSLLCTFPFCLLIILTVSLHSCAHTAYNILRDPEQRARYDQLYHTNTNSIPETSSDTDTNTNTNTNTDTNTQPDTNTNTNEPHPNPNSHHSTSKEPPLYERGKGVVLLSKDYGSFASMIDDKTRVWLVQFANASHHQCREFAPVWHGLAKNLTGIVKLSACASECGTAS